jgi:exodeoxyribonuclease VII large subunit
VTSRRWNSAARSSSEPRHAEAEDPDVEDVFSVTELVEGARRLLEHRAGAVVVVGELTDWRRYPSGHCYGTLRDGQSQLPVVLYRREASRLLEHPEPGMELLVHGRLTVYSPRGTLQCVAQQIRLSDGAGLETLAKERLLRRLRDAGRLSPARKRLLPVYPGSIGVVTSETSAALGDIIECVNRQAPWVRVVVADAQLNGPGAARSIASAIRDLDASTLVKVILVARGGGSVADLAPYDSEEVAEAIAACTVPVVSAVGHELHTTVADAVADVRAATPSAAAAMVVPNAPTVRAEFAKVRMRAGRALLGCVAVTSPTLRSIATQLSAALRSRLLLLDARAQAASSAIRHVGLGQIVRRTETQIVTQRRDARRELRARAAETDRRWSAARNSARGAPSEMFEHTERRLAAVAARLHSASPLRLLANGYAAVTRGGEAVTTCVDVHAGDDLTVHMADGRLHVRVQAVRSQAASAAGD